MSEVEDSLRAGSLNVLVRPSILAAKPRSASRREEFFSPGSKACQLANRRSAAKILARITHQENLLAG